MSNSSVLLGERYRLESSVASGGMATVWRATDTVLARVVAVKVLHDHLVQDEGFLARFRREALAAAQLTHPNIVAIYDTGTTRRDDAGDQHFIVMEYCGGGTLADVRGARGAFSPQEAARTGARLCDALGYAHSSGIIHRDVKPPNILLTDEGTVKIADFGIAKAAFEAGDITTTGSILGTVAYISPEQSQGLEPDARSDIYSTGVVLYELLAGRPPFAAETPIATAMAHLKEAPPPLRSQRAGIPKALEAVVMKALAKDPDERFGTAEEMRDALEATLGRAQGTASRPERAQTGAASTSPRNEIRSILPVLGLVAAAIVLALWLPSLLTPEERGGGRVRAGDPAIGKVSVVLVDDFDPYESAEDPEDAPLAADGDPGTTWDTETYQAPLDLLQKPGVGLVFDLGDAIEIRRVVVTSDTPGYTFELRTSDAIGENEQEFGLAERVSEAPAAADVRLDDPVSARYWLLWITSLPGTSGGSVSIGEVEFFGTV